MRTGKDTDALSPVRRLPSSTYGPWSTRDSRRRSRPEPSVSWPRSGWFRPLPCTLGVSVRVPVTGLANTRETVYVCTLTPGTLPSFP